MEKSKGNIYSLVIVRILHSKKNILLSILLYFLIIIYVKPLKNFASQSGCFMITPYIYPFLLTDTNFLTLFILGVIYYFSTIPFMKHWNGYYILRRGRRIWFFAQIKYILVSGLVITFVAIIWTNIALLPYLHIEAGWGKVLYTLAKTDAKNICNLFFEFSTQFMSHNSPFKAMCISIILSVLGINFFGILMFTCSLVLSRTASIIIANTLVVYSCLIVHIGNIPQRITTIFSPVSWMKIANYGVTNYGYNAAPSLYFTISAYIILTFLLICIGDYKVKNIDFIWRNEDE